MCAGHATVVIQAGVCQTIAPSSWPVKRVKRSKRQTPLIRWLTAIPGDDPRKAAVEAAIARAKARSRSSRPEANLPKAVDPQSRSGGSGYRPRQSPQAGAAGRRRTCRSGRSAQSRGGSAAIARAKARKQEQQAGSEPAEPVDPRKAAVEAAIARAKARKQEQQAEAAPAEPPTRA